MGNEIPMPERIPYPRHDRTLVRALTETGVHIDEPTHGARWVKYKLPPGFSMANVSPYGNIVRWYILDANNTPLFYIRRCRIEKGNPERELRLKRVKNPAWVPYAHILEKLLQGNEGYGGLFTSEYVNAMYEE